MSGSITDIKGITVGHYTDKKAKTGCTAVICQKGAVAGVDVRGSAPGTRETDLLRGYNSVERVQAIMLSGGSAYGLDAASGAMQYFEEQGLGVDVGIGVVPIVPAAVIFDLGVGDPKVRPGKAEGYAACKDAKDSTPSGSIGAGTGATVAKAFGSRYAVNSGLGTACIELENGVKVGAIAVVNALGDIYDPETGELVAAANMDGKLTPCIDQYAVNAVARACGVGALGQAAFGNTTIGVVATNARLTREEANKLASMAHDGLAMTIRPVHTSLDGDTFFAMSTGERECELLPVLVAGVRAVSAAILDAVRSAE